MDGGEMIYSFLYRLVMKISHKFNWHYATPIYLEGNKHLWCKWCGFRANVVEFNNKTDLNNLIKDIRTMIQNENTR